MAATWFEWILKQMLLIIAVLLITSAIALADVNRYQAVRLKELVVIDPKVFYHEKILDKLPRDARVVFLSGDTPGLDQLTKILAREKDIRVLRIFSHGAPGQVVLNGEVIDSRTLARYRETFRLWAQAFAPNADILLYGCNVAETEKGREFVDRLAEYTGADVAASTDRTGGLENEWALEYHAGNIEAAFLSVEGYSGYLANCSVNNDGDTGSGSDTEHTGDLRFCINDVGAGEEITFDDDYTITLTSELTISQDLTITGTGIDKTIIQANAVPDTATYRVFTINGGTVILQNMTIRNGNPSSEGGGGIYNSATLTVDNCTISDNTANSAGGGIWNDGTINALSNSTIIGNTANSEGGGIYNSEYRTISSLSNSTISGNRADNGGGIFNSDYSTINALSNSTIIGNTANSAGGGIYNFGGIEISDYSTINALSNSTISGNTANSAGGGIYNYNSTINALSNSTISGNTAENGGGIFNYNGTINALSNSTISGNTATKNGGGISNPYSYGLISLANSIVINNNSGSDSGTDILNSGTLNAYYSWYNQVSGTINTQETAPNVTSSYSEGNLGELADNGGPTWTMAVTSGPAYEAGHFVYYNATDGYYLQGNDDNYYEINSAYTQFTPSDPASDKITTDQRGYKRYASSPTIGAYDQDPTVVKLTSFTARGFSDRVDITWETASEIDTAGFHIWRSITQDGTYSKITTSLIPAEGSATTGATYTYKDTAVTPPNVYYYKLADVSTSGARSDHGPVAAAVGDAAAREVTGPGTIGAADTAGGLGSITLEGSGSHTVTTGKYAAQPGGTAALTGASGWWVVDVTNPSGLSTLTLRFCPAASSDGVYFWNGSQWRTCSRQEYADSCLQVTITASTTPAISDMSQLVFALTRANPAIPTLSQWGLIVLLMLLAATGGIAIRRKENDAA